jgi:hypothetical protein
MSATEEFPGDFGPVTNYFAATVTADRGKRLNCTLEAVKNMARPSGHYFEAFVIVIPANFTLGHSTLHLSLWDSH